jgi:diaminohydroxyphosphoribosylaminopyrimidine deaminase/5-amino-6-(5-phosphoribosylamino)uracil reductase
LSVKPTRSGRGTPRALHEAEEHLRAALLLAARGRGSASPNPMVGALVVRDGRVVGRGFHRSPGESHAEVRALRKAGAAARGATLYVNLEPCAHHGRTPPCVDAIRHSGIRRVVASMKDPNPLVRGRGFSALRRAGVEVECGLLGLEARLLNEAYVHHVRTGRPFVVLKAGTSLDGRIAAAGGRSRWITSPAARQAAHDLRWEFDAILVGVGTVLADDPELAARRAGRERPGFRRVVLDTSLRTPVRSRLVRGAPRRPLLIYAGEQASRAREKSLQAAGATIRRVACKAGRVSVAAALRDLGRCEMRSLLVEGGGEVHASFLGAGLADKVVLFMAPTLLGGGAVPLVGGKGVTRPELAHRLKDLTLEQCGPDLRITGYPVPAHKKRGR